MKNPKYVIACRYQISTTFKFLPMTDQDISKLFQGLFSDLNILITVMSGSETTKTATPGLLNNLRQTITLESKGKPDVEGKKQRYYHDRQSLTLKIIQPC